MSRVRSAVRLAAVAFFALAGVVTTAVAQDQATAPAGRPLGLYIFISSQGDVQSALTPDELRGTVEAGLSALYAVRGPVAGTATLAPLVRRHRVRTSLLATAAFCADAAAELGLEALELVDVIILPDNIVLAVREVALPSGILRSAQWTVREVTRVESGIDAEALVAGWRENLVRLCASIDPAEQSAAIGDPLAVLPFQQRGADAVAALVATHMLLRNIVSEGSARVPDPSLLVTSMHRAGLDAELLNGAVREIVAQRLSCQRILAPSMFSYAPQGRDVQADVPDFSGTIHENILLASGELTLSTVNVADGTLGRSAALYFELRRETGWFGIPDKRTPVVQLEAAIGNLWRSYSASQREDS